MIQHAKAKEEEGGPVNYSLRENRIHVRWLQSIGGLQEHLEVLLGQRASPWVGDVGEDLAELVLEHPVLLGFQLSSSHQSQAVISHKHQLL